MSNLLKKIAVLLVIFSLPLQSLHALAMPVCGPDEQKTAAQQGDAALHKHDHGAPDADPACDGCSLCHTCSAAAIAPFAIQRSLDDAVDTPPATLLTHISLFVPEQPQRPPIA